MKHKSIAMSAMTGVAFAIGVIISHQASALDTAELEVAVTETLTDFEKEVSNAGEIIGGANGALVCPTIRKGGLILAVERGSCAMQIDGKTVGYYRLTGVKGGAVIGIESHSMILIFNDADVLAKFRDDKREWEVGADFQVAVAKKGASGGFDTTTMKDPVTAFVFGEKGLMADISLQGSRFKKLDDKPPA